MEYQYVARAENNTVVKGKVTATSEGAAADMLSYSGYSVLSLKEKTSLFKSEMLSMELTSGVKPLEVIMFSRQLALLLESGTDVVTSMELLEAQADNKHLKKVLAQVVADVRGGVPLSEAMSHHKKVFSSLYYRLVAVGERTGTLEVVLRRAADYMERSYVTRKSVKNALTYPFVVILHFIFLSLHNCIEFKISG